MSSDDEIEYLDEDAEIVQQYVQVPANSIEENKNQTRLNLENPPLLIERSSERKKKRKWEDDSDYDPQYDDVPESPERWKPKKKPIRRSGPPPRTRLSSPVKVTERQAFRYRASFPSSIVTRGARKKMDIRVPDYEDPLCLPVKAIRYTGADAYRLRVWNNGCLNQLKLSHTLLKPNKGTTKKSIRTTVLRNVSNKETGIQETAVWTKTSVFNKEGAKKSDVFQCVLPRYQEKVVLANLKPTITRKNPTTTYNEVLLTKEDTKDEPTLVVYNPKTAISAVYKYMKNEDGMDTSLEEDRKRSMKEVTCCKMCAPCYQVSWRGCSDKGSTKKLQCPICERTMISVYNLLTHLKGHPKELVVKYKRAISVTLAGVLDYHYKCRICQQQLLSIKSLRQHVASHKGTIPFTCEVGNHLTS